MSEIFDLDDEMENHFNEADRAKQSMGGHGSSVSKHFQQAFKDPSEALYITTETLKHGEIPSIQNANSGTLSGVLQELDIQRGSLELNENLEESRNFTQEQIDLKVIELDNNLESGTPEHHAAVADYVLHNPRLRDELMPDLRGEQKASLISREGERQVALDSIEAVDYEKLLAFSKSAEVQKDHQTTIEQERLYYKDPETEMANQRDDIDEDVFGR